MWPAVAGGDPAGSGAAVRRRHRASGAGSAPAGPANGPPSPPRRGWPRSVSSTDDQPGRPLPRSGAAVRSRPPPRGCSWSRVVARGRRPVHQASLTVVGGTGAPTSTEHCRDTPASAATWAIGRCWQRSTSRSRPAGSQRGITVGHAAGLLAARTSGSHFSSSRRGPASSPQPRVTNLIAATPSGYAAEPSTGPGPELHPARGPVRGIILQELGRGAADSRGRRAMLGEPCCTPSCCTALC